MIRRLSRRLCGASPGAVALGLVALAFASAAAPLLLYSLSLAAFGLAHVLAELAYVDRRFGPRLSRPFTLTLGGLLLALVATRVLGIARVLPGGAGALLEVSLAIALALAALPLLARAGRRPLLLGVTAAAGLALGLSLSPALTLLSLAVLHNLTPVGFLVEVAAPDERPAVLALSCALFVGGPLVVASGLPAALLAGLGLFAPDLTVLPTGPLAAHLGAYLPKALHDAPFATHAFAGIVFAQLLHYGAVLHALPRALPAGAPELGALPWPSSRATRLLGGGLLCTALLAFFAFDFRAARSIYGVFAVVHAWVELPLLLVALVPAAALPRRAR